MSQSHPEPAALTSAPPCAAPREQGLWFKQEVHPHDGPLKSYLRGQFPSVRDVEDVVQESYLKIWKARSTQKIESARAFLFTIAKRLALDQIRRARSSPHFSASDLSVLSVVEERESVHDHIGMDDKHRLLGQALASLPERARHVIILHKIDGFTQPEIQQRLNLSPKAVENLVFRGMAGIRKFLREQGIEYFTE